MSKKPSQVPRSYPRLMEAIVGTQLPEGTQLVRCSVSDAPRNRLGNRKLKEIGLGRLFHTFDYDQHRRAYNYLVWQRFVLRSIVFGVTTADGGDTDFLGFVQRNGRRPHYGDTIPIAYVPYTVTERWGSYTMRMRIAVLPENMKPWPPPFPPPALRSPSLDKGLLPRLRAEANA